MCVPPLILTAPRGRILTPSHSLPQKVVLIDVREPEEIAQGSIPSSVALPLSGIKAAILSPPGEFEQKYGFRKPGDGSQDVIFYCRSGKRSATACDEAVKQGWQNVKNYEGSWLDWTKREAERKGN